MLKREDLIFERFVVGMLQTNCYLLADPHSRKAVIVDPGGGCDRILRRITEANLDLVAIANTHSHFDHVMDAWKLKKRLGGEIYLHPKEEPFLWDSVTGMGAFFGMNSGTSDMRIDRTYQEGDLLQVGSMEFRVLDTPGHSPGHVSLHLPPANLILVGDTLFAGSIGRTDLPGGSYEQLIRSVREKIFPLDPGTVVFPGHGPETTVGEERRTNPFFL